MAITSNTTFVAGNILTAQQQNNFPFGVVGAVQSVAGNLTIGAALADLTGQTVTFTAIAGRTYKFNVAAVGTSAVNQDYIYVVVTDASNFVYAGVLNMCGAGEYANLNFSQIVNNLTAGSVTFKLRAQTAAGAATILRSGSDILQFWIEDIGTA